MELFIQYWDAILIMVFAIVALGVAVYKFIIMPNGKRKEQIRMWLLEAVLVAEKSWDSGTGKIKISSVYDKFIQRFGIVAILMPKKVFEQLVDEALDDMKELLKENPNLTEQ